MRDAARLIERDALRFGDDFREQRLRVGASLAAIARAIGVANSVVWRIEHGDPTVGLDARARAARVVGGTARLSFYANSTPLIYDAAHARMIERLVSVARRCWHVTLEKPVPGPGHRSVDLSLDGAGTLVLIEIESRVRRWEAALRELADKRRAFADAGEHRTVHVVLAIPPTRHHRALIRALPESVGAALPVDSTALRRALKDGGTWPGDGILWIGSGPIRREEADG